MRRATTSIRLTRGDPRRVLYHATAFGDVAEPAGYEKSRATAAASKPVVMKVACFGGTKRYVRRRSSLAAAVCLRLTTSMGRMAPRL